MLFFVLYVCEDGTGFTRGVTGGMGGEMGMPTSAPGHGRHVMYLVDRRRMQVISYCLGGCGVAGGTH